MSAHGDAHTRLVRELASAHTIVTAVETGLLTELVEREASAMALAAELDLDVDAVDRMLGVLASMGWVEATTIGWYAADWLRDSESGGLTVRRMSAVFRHLGTMARDGSVMMRGEVRHDATGVAGLAELFGGAPRELAEALPPVAGTILDLGAGSATWSLAMAGDETRVVAVDRENVLDAAATRAETMDLSNALECLPGSFWDVELPPADRVVIANVVHLFDANRASVLVRRAVSCLRPGGLLVVVDVMGDEPLAPSIAAYALQLRLREPNGTVHARASMSEWLREAGLEDVRTIPLATETMALGAVVGQR